MRPRGRPRARPEGAGGTWEADDCRVVRRTVKILHTRFTSSTRCSGSPPPVGPWIPEIGAPSRPGGAPQGRCARGPVSRVLDPASEVATISLGPRSRAASNDLPGRQRRGSSPTFPIWSFSGWGLPCRTCHQARGALLPHRFTLTARCQRVERGSARIATGGGLLSVALSLASRPVAVNNHPDPWSPDFPPPSRNSGAVARTSHAAAS